MIEKKKIGFIGVGLMGHGIAANVQRAGWDIGFLDHPGNQPTDDLTAKGARSYSTAAELASESDVIIICVTGSPEVEHVLNRIEGVLQGLRPGTVIIDCSTALPASTLKLAAIVEAEGGRFLDAPMTRTPKEAAEGRLNLIVGGDRKLYEEQLPLLRSFAENITHAGKLGSGHRMKLLHNFVSLGFSAVLAEAVACSKRAGIDAKILHSVLASGGGAGVILDRMTPYILDKDETGFRFSLSNAAKDIDYYAAMSEELDASGEIATAVRALYNSQVEAGHGTHFVPQLIDLLAGRE